MFKYEYINWIDENNQWLISIVQLLITHNNGISASEGGKKAMFYHYKIKVQPHFIKVHFFWLKHKLNLNPIHIHFNLLRVLIIHVALMTYVFIIVVFSCKFTSCKAHPQQ